MAKKVTVSLIDDLNGDVANETVGFGLDGKSYEIDLSLGNAARLREELTAYVAAARRVQPSVNGRPARRAGQGTSAAQRAQNQVVRDWLNAHGHKVSDRGRIPVGLLDIYNQAHPAAS